MNILKIENLTVKANEKEILKYYGTEWYWKIYFN